MPRQARHIGKATGSKAFVQVSDRLKGHMSVWVEDPGELRERASVWHEIAHPRAFVGVPCGSCFASAFDYYAEFVLTRIAVKE